MHDGLLATYLDYDHRERKNVRFLGKFSPVQYLRCSPSWTVALLNRGASDGIQVLGDGGETKVRNACTTRLIYKDVLLAGCQHGKTRVRIATYRLEVPMDHVAAVEVAETLSDIG